MTLAAWRRELGRCEPGRCSGSSGRRRAFGIDGRAACVQVRYGSEPAPGNWGDKSVCDDVIRVRASLRGQQAPWGSCAAGCARKQSGRLDPRAQRHHQQPAPCGTVVEFALLA